MIVGGLVAVRMTFGHGGLSIDCWWAGDVSNYLWCTGIGFRMTVGGLVARRMTFGVRVAFRMTCGGMAAFRMIVGGLVALRLLVDGWPLE